MSGGAVFDTHCGLLCITESRTIFAEGGQVVLLKGDVLKRVAAAVEAADGGGRKRRGGSGVSGARKLVIAQMWFSLSSGCTRRCLEHLQRRHCA